MAQRLVTTENLGAWLVKCNADFSDVAEWAVTGHRVERWCVRPGYRTELMALGQRVVFWVGGSRSRLVHGVWGVGYLAGAARSEPIPVGAAGPVPTGPDRLPAGGGDRRSAAAVRWYVPLELGVLPPDERVRREDLRADPRLADLEVFRQPQAANPSYLTTAQVAALADHVSWPVSGVA
ncbi:MAG TPA: hypothetical protein VF755_29850 [Catenuloplanes sp.]|jgi:hypothetical protein